MAMLTKKVYVCRKDDRAMRPIYGCPKNFQEYREFEMQETPLAAGAQPRTQLGILELFQTL